jgi:hypothetical protein
MCYEETEEKKLDFSSGKTGPNLILLSRTTKRYYKRLLFPRASDVPHVTITISCFFHFAYMLELPLKEQVNIKLD